VSAASGERELLHKRDFAFEGYRRADGHYDIEGRMTDRKTYAFPNDFRGEIQADEPLHDMRVRVTIDEDFMILAVETETAAGPFAICPAITPVFAALKGARIGRGWSALLKERFGGVQGCTHHVELLRALATVAFQTIYGEQQRRRRAHPKASPGEAALASPGEAGGAKKKRPAFIDTCHALAADGEVVKQSWPDFYQPKG
jgi:hypothetical protein